MAPEEEVLYMNRIHCNFDHSRNRPRSSLYLALYKYIKSLFTAFRRNNSSCTLPNPQVFIEYCKKIFKSNESENILEFQDSEPFVELDVQGTIFRPIRQEDFDDAIEKSISKSICIDGYAPEMLKSLRRILRTILPSVLNHCMSERKLPNLFLKNHFIFIHKGDDNNNPENYRTIAINNPFAEVFWKTIYNRFLAHAGLQYF